MKAFSRAADPERIGAKSLLELSIAAARRNIQFVEYTGDLPLHILLPVVRAVERPTQLALLEEGSPQLKGHTSEMWFNMIKRDVYEWEKMLLSKKKKNGENWTLEEIKKKATVTTYRRCRAKAKKALKRDEEVLRQETAKDVKERQEKETRIVEKVPLSWQKPRQSSSTANRSKSDGVMNRIRREAAAHRLTRPGGSLATPSHLLHTTPRPQPVIRRMPPMRRLLEPPSASNKIALDAKVKLSAPDRLDAKAKNNTNKVTTKKAESDTNSAEERISKSVKSPGKKPPDNSGNNRLSTTPKRKREPTVLLPVKRSK